mmetsp:Transcript_142048/g.441699  ORF Transcript_142048/g.441699 Transcript_142048/m.441699 type:complete len:399 (+) Transcript_142048:1184-2380(+)
MCLCVPLGLRLALAAMPVPLPVGAGGAAMGLVPRRLETALGLGARTNWACRRLWLLLPRLRLDGRLLMLHCRLFFYVRVVCGCAGTGSMTRCWSHACRIGSLGELTVPVAVLVGRAAWHAFAVLALTADTVPQTGSACGAAVRPVPSGLEVALRPGAGAAFAPAGLVLALAFAHALAPQALHHAFHALEHALAEHLHAGRLRLVQAAPVHGFASELVVCTGPAMKLGPPGKALGAQVVVSARLALEAWPLDGACAAAIARDGAVLQHPRKEGKMHLHPVDELRQALLLRGEELLQQADAGVEVQRVQARQQSEQELPCCVRRRALGQEDAKQLLDVAEARGCQQGPQPLEPRAQLGQMAEGRQQMLPEHLRLQRRQEGDRLWKHDGRDAGERSRGEEG